MIADDKEPDSSPETDSLANDIVGIQAYNYSVPPKKKFLPWHRPRKQFIRNDQWCYLTQQLMDGIGAGADTLTYFGLPGVDLLDLRYFGAKVCEPRSLKLRFLGFDKSAHPKSENQTELNISLDEVIKSPSFHPQSEIIGDDIRSLADENSIAWRKTFEIGPYDVINLDLCDGFGAQEPGKFDQTYYNLISRLLSVQARRKSPWLLLLTTRVGSAHTHLATLNRLTEIYIDNLDNCPSFRAASIKQYNMADKSSVQAAKRTPAGLQSLFLVGLSKWLLRFASSQNPPSTMEVKSVLGYRVNDGANVEDMVSIAMRFDPHHGATRDPSNLASLSPMIIDECDLATKALKRVGNLVDVDELLASQEEIRNEMVEAMCTLLAAARYDIDEYRKICAL